MRETAITKNLKKVTGEMLEMVPQGLSLSEIILKTGMFPTMACKVVETGERTGNINNALSGFLLLLKNKEGNKEKIKEVLSYPVIGLFFSVGLVLFFSFSVIPVMPPVHNPPFTLRVLIGINHHLFSYMLILAVGAATCFWVFYYLFRANEKRFYLFFYKLPLAGAIASELFSANFIRTFGAFLISGASMREALEFILPAFSKNKYLEEVLSGIKSGVVKGESISAIVQKTLFFPSYLWYFIKKGEETGSMGESMVEAADFIDHTIQEKINMVIPFVQPIIFLVSASIIALVGIAYFKGVNSGFSI